MNSVGPGGKGYIPRGVDANLGQHTRALESASRKRTEGQRGRANRSDRLNRPVRPVSRVSPESVVSRGVTITLTW